MRNVLLLTAFQCIFGLYLHAQNFILHDHHALESFLVNPAYSGIGYFPKSTVSYSKQWFNIQQSPKSYYLSANIRLGKYNYYNPKMLLNKSKYKSLERVGLGAGLYADEYGPYKELNLLIAYAYHIPIGFGSQLSFGISGRGSVYGANRALIKPKHADDPYIQFESFTKANANLGASFTNNQYTLGLSLINILKHKDLGKPYQNNEGIQAIISGNYRYYLSSNFLFEPGLAYGISWETPNHFFLYSGKLYLKNLGWISLTLKNNVQMGTTVAIKAYRKVYIAYRFAHFPKETGLNGNHTHGILIGKNLGVDLNTSFVY